jgi:hypothetical protein
MTEEKKLEDLQMHVNLVFKEQMDDVDIIDTIEEFKIMLDRARDARSTRVTIRVITCNNSRD